MLLQPDLSVCCTITIVCLPAHFLQLASHYFAHCASFLLCFRPLWISRMIFPSTYWILAHPTLAYPTVPTQYACRLVHCAVTRAHEHAHPRPPRCHTPCVCIVHLGHVLLTPPCRRAVSPTTASSTPLALCCTIPTHHPDDPTVPSRPPWDLAPSYKRVITQISEGLCPCPPHSPFPVMPSPHPPHAVSSILAHPAISASRRCRARCAPMLGSPPYLYVWHLSFTYHSCSEFLDHVHRYR